MKKCVELTIDTDTGNIHVMECEPKEEMGEGGMSGEMMDEGMGSEGDEMSGGKMQNFEDMDSALQFAAELLTSDTRSDEEKSLADAQKGYGNKPRMGGMEKRPSVGQVFGDE